MANFFKDNDDLQYYFDKGVDWDSLVRLTEHEFADADEELPASDLDEFESDAEDGVDDDIENAVEISSKEQNARSLEIRRAIEERMEERQMHEDLDYLDFDMDE